MNGSKALVHVRVMSIIGSHSKDHSFKNEINSRKQSSDHLKIHWSSTKMYGTADFSLQFVLHNDAWHPCKGTPKGRYVKRDTLMQI